MEINKILTIFFSDYFENIEKIYGGYGERVFGLYGSYSNNFSSKDHTIFIYTQRNRTLLTFNNSKILKIKENLNPFLLINIIGREYRSYKTIRLIVSWPNVPILTVIVLLILKYFYHCKIILDVHDLQEEQSREFFLGKNKFFLTKYHSILTYFMFKWADSLIMTSDIFLDYVEKKYKVNKNKMNIIENGTFPDVIFPLKKTVYDDQFTITYCGSLVEGKGITQIITLINHLKQKKIPVVFKIFGANVLGLIPNEFLQIDSVPFSQINNILNQADVLIIPYPKKLYFDITHPIKLSDYMASGKPIVCLNLSTVGDIIKKFDCGVVCKDYQNFEDVLIDLYHNPEKRSMLGSKGRIAAISYFDWNILAQRMDDILVNI